MSATDGWETTASKKKSKSQKESGMIPAPIPEPRAKTVETPTINVEDSTLFCTQCYDTHESKMELYHCKSQICTHCQLITSKTHNESLCIAAVCDPKKFGCGKRGHTVDRCILAPEPCKFCNERGHTIDTCEKLKNAVCTKCHEKGHTMSACPKRFVCSYCKSKSTKKNPLDPYHKMFEFDGDTRLISCEVLTADVKSGKYICDRCGYEDCYRDCVNH